MPPLRLTTEHRWLLLWVIIVWANQVGQSPAVETDQVRLEALAQHHLQRSWDNVEGEPLWVAGARPRKRWANSLHTVTLSPGQEMTIRAPARSMVRVLGVHQPLTPHAIDVWVSDGSGLSTKRLSAITEDRRSLVYVPDNTRPYLARIRHPADQPAPVEVAVFTSRWDSPRDLIDYQESRVAIEPQFRIKRPGATQSQNYFCLHPRQSRVLSLTGPARIALETRYRYPPSEHRSFQAFRIGVRLDGVPYQTLEYQTGAETRQTLVDERVEVLGRREVAYLSIPAGRHDLELDATADVYARLSTYESNNYLLRRNQPPWLPGDPRPLYGLETERYSSWDISSQAAERLPRLRHELIPAQEQLAHRSARDNRHLEGGLRGMMLMQTAAAFRADDPTVGRVAEEIRGFHTFFRNLLPSEASGRQTFAWFPVQTLPDDDAIDEQRVIAEQHIDDLVDRLSKAYFTDLSESPSGTHRYRLPSDLGTTLLRVAVASPQTPGPVRLRLQYDQRVPLELELTDPSAARETSHAELALAALHWRHAAFDHGTLGGPFSQHRLPARLLQAATAELRVPSGVREIRLWSSSGTDRSIEVALQYRASRPYQLSESEFLAMQRRTPRDTAEILRLALEGQMEVPTPAGHRDADDANRELANHWLPLVRYLRSQRRAFEMAVVPRGAENHATLVADDFDLHAAVHRARRFASDQQWLPTLETWGQIVPRTAGDLRREGLVTQAVALQRLGEAFLADRTLRGLFLFDQDPAIRDAAFDQLKGTRARAESTDALEQLLATAVARSSAAGTPDANSSNQLAQILLDNGDDELALLLSLATPVQHRAADNILRAAYRLRWWDLFEREVASLPDTRSGFWRGLRMQSEGNYQRALAEFRTGGPDCEPYAAHFAKAVEIHAGLQSGSIDERVRAVFDWERWQGTHPGPRVWQDAGAIVQRHAGTESIYSVDRNLYAQFYKADQKQPLVLRVPGPQTLQFECRPIHTSDANSPVDDWVHVYTVEGHRPVAINANRPSTGLRIVGDPEHVPGRQVTTRLTLGPGLHEINITAGKLPLLVRVYAQRPALPIVVLPTLTPETLAVATDLGFAATSTSATGPSFQLIPTDGQHAIHLAVSQQRPTPWPTARAVPSDPLLAARLALRTPDALARHATTLETWARRALANTAHANTAAEATLALARLNSGSPLPRDPGPAWEPLPPVAREPDVVNDWDDLQNTSPPRALQASLRRRMTQLVWLAERNETLRGQCQMLGQQLFHDHPEVDGLAGLHARLTREGAWSRVTQLTASAGVRRLDWPNWVPESPTLRIRKSLMATMDRSEHLLFGREAKVLSMRNFDPVQLNLVLAPAPVGHLPSKPLQVACQVGDSPPHWTAVHREGPDHHLRMTIPAGLQHVRFWVDDPTANHFVRLDVRELATADPLCTRPPGAIDFHATQRVYDVATHDEPVRMLIEGPAWLRIDELRVDQSQGETTYVRYIAVEEAQRQVELRPGSDQEEAILRVFAFTPQPGAEVPASHWVRVEPEPLPPPLIQISSWDEPLGSPSGSANCEPTFPDTVWHDELELLALRSPDAPVVSLDIYDDRPLGGQEDGTWSISLGGVSRRALEEGLNGRVPGQFLETRLTHRHYDDWAETYRKTDLLIRQREMSGPTFGLLHRLRRPLPHCPLVFEFDASGYLQDPGGAILPTDDLEWSAAVRGRLRYRQERSPRLHRTLALSVFGRALSQDQNNYLAGRVDQDIFTTYKANHPVGLTLSDTWVYAPWMDTRWWLRPSLITNQDFNPLRPDQLNLRIGWAQAIGLAEVEASYRLTWFLEDQDRANPRLQNLLYFDVLTDLPPFCRRSELAFRMQHDLDRGTTSAQLSATWYFDRGRLDHDRWPGERTFPAIRRQRHATLLGQTSRY